MFEHFDLIAHALSERFDGLFWCFVLRRNDKICDFNRRRTNHPVRWSAGHSALAINFNGFFDLKVEGRQFLIQQLQ